MDSGVTAEHLPLIIIIFFYCSFDLNFFCVLVQAVLLLSYCIFYFKNEQIKIIVVITPINQIKFNDLDMVCFLF